MQPDRKPSNVPESEAQFYQHLSHLVEQSLAGRPGKAKPVQKDLINEVTSHPFYDPVLVVFEQAQRLLLTDIKPKTAKHIVDFIHDFSMAAQNDVVSKREKPLRLNQRVNKALGNILQNDSQIQKDPSLQVFIKTTSIAFT